MTDKELLHEMFKRLDDNFEDLDDLNVAITDSEVADDALNETLFNMGLDSMVERISFLDEQGIWKCKYVVKE